jgi:hypothetical protein
VTRDLNSLVCKRGYVSTAATGVMWHQSARVRETVLMTIRDMYLILKKALLSQYNPFVAITCSALDSPSHGSVHIAGNRADYSCIIKGYLLVGPRWRRCNSHGEWAGEAPICKCEPFPYCSPLSCFEGILSYLYAVVATCGKPPSPQNGFVKFSRTTVGARAIHYCKKGFVLRGRRVRVCRGNRRWSGRTPRCVRSRYRQ